MQVQAPNVKSYLPPELAFTAPKNTNADLGAFGRNRPQRGALRRVARRPRPVVVGVPPAPPAQEMEEEEEEEVDDVQEEENVLEDPGSGGGTGEEEGPPPVVSLRALRPTRRDRGAATLAEAPCSKRSRLAPPEQDQQPEEHRGAPEAGGGTSAQQQQEEQEQEEAPSHPVRSRAQANGAENTSPNEGGAGATGPRSGRRKQ